MPKKRSRKSRLLKAAVSYAGQTMASFAASLDVTEQHLRLVLSGERESPRVLKAVDEYIRRQLPGVEIAA